MTEVPLPPTGSGGVVRGQSDPAKTIDRSRRILRAEPRYFGFLRHQHGPPVGRRPILSLPARQGLRVLISGALSLVVALSGLVAIELPAAQALPQQTFSITPTSGPAAGGTQVTVTPPAGVTFTSVSAGDDYSLAIGSDGNTYAWGDNTAGKLGDGTNTMRLTPVLVTTGSLKFTSVAAGETHSLAVGTDNKLYAWGLNDEGQLGDGTNTDRWAPQQVQNVPAGITFTSVSAGYKSSLALGSDGKAYTWGWAASGRLGNNTNSPSVSTPASVAMPSGVTFTTAIIHGSHALAIGNNGMGYAWGWNYSGQLGDGSTIDRWVPTAVSMPPGVKFTKLSPGAYQSLAIGDNGKVYAWGSNSNGQLGVSTNTSLVPTPQLVPNLPSSVTFTSVSTATGEGHSSFAFGNDGRVWAWGQNDLGQLGCSSCLAAAAVPTPVNVSLPPSVTFSSLSAGNGHALAVGSDGNVYAWGNNASGQLGDGTQTNHTAPAAVPVSTVVTAVSFGGVAGTGLAQNGPVWTVTTPAQAAAAAAVDVVLSWTIAGVAQTPLTLTGGYRYIASIVPAAQSAVPAVGVRMALTQPLIPVGFPAAPTYTIAPALPNGLTLNATTGVVSGTPTVDSAQTTYTITGTSGAVSATSSLVFGNGLASVSSGQVGTVVSVPGVSFTQVSGGATHTLGLGSDGRVYAWGSNSDGQLGVSLATSSSLTPVAVSMVNVPAGVSFTQISSSGWASLALGSDGRVYAWGRNDGGQAGSSSPAMIAAPTPVTGGALAGVTVVQVMTDGGFGVALGSDGKAYTWGSNASGQLGNGGTANSTTPVAVTMPAGVTFRYVSASGGHALALGSDGKAYTWGSNAFGQLGNGGAANSSTPVVVAPGAVPTGVVFTRVTAAGGGSYGLGSDGKVYAWGSNAYGQLGIPTGTASSSVPVAVSQGAVPAGVALTQVAAGLSHALALGSDGKVYAWGSNGNGQLGNNSTANSYAPVAVLGLPVSVATLSASWTGDSMSLGLGSDGRVYAWGANPNGQLGNGTTTASLTAVLSANAVATGVSFGGVAATVLPPQSNGSTQATAPPNPPGPVNVVVTATMYGGTTATSFVTTRSLSGTFTVLPATMSPSSLPNITASAGTPIVPTSPFITSGFGGSVSYRVSPSLPAGLTLNSSIGIISGAPAVAVAAATYVITATGASSGSATASVTIATSAVIAPAMQSATVRTGVPIALTSRLIGIGFPAAPTYTIAPALPSGLAFNVTTGVISGSSSTPSAQATYTITGTSGGVSATSTISLSVLGVSVSSGQVGTVVSVPGVSFTQVSGGATHTLGLGSDGRVYAWGSNSDGQLGVSLATSSSLTPVAVSMVNVPAGVSFTQISSSGWASLALGSDGRVYAWGRNDGGQAGSSSPAMIAAPTPVTGGALAGVTVVQVMTDGGFGVALGSDGKAYTWGSNASGQLGNGGTANSTTPVAVTMPAGVTFRYVSASGGHALALGSDGKAYTWGSNAFGQLGNGGAANSSTPVVVAPGAVPTGVVFTRVTAAGGGSYGLGSDGKVYAWGSNAYGQLGIPTGTASSSVPVAVSQGAVPAGVALTQVAAGLSHALALGSDGKVYAWGSNGNGQLGNNSTANSYAPVAVLGLPVSVATLSASWTGDSMSLGLGSDGRVYAWGANPNGQLGNGTTTASLTAVLSANAVATGVSFGGVAATVLTPQSNGSTQATAPPTSRGGVVDIVVTQTLYAGSTASGATVLSTFASSFSYPQMPPSAPVLAPPAATVGVAYSYQIPTPPSGTPPFTYTLNGTLPAGLLLDPATGVIAGTPTGAGSSGTFTVTVDNALTSQNHSGSDTTASVTFTSSVVAPAYSVSVSQYLAVSSSLQWTPTLVSGSPATSWTATNLPAWVNLDQVTGVLTGTAPSTTETDSFTLVGQNATGAATISYQLTVQALPVAPVVAPPAATVGVAYSYQIPTPGGTGPFTYTLNGTLPAGLLFDPATGVIAGTPTGAGSSGTFTVTVDNALTSQNHSGSDTTASVTFTSTVLPPVVTSPGTRYLLTGSALSFTPVFVSGSPVTSWTVASGSTKPAWVNLDQVTGVLTGTAPSTTETDTFSVVAANAGGSITLGYTLIVQALPVAPVVAPPAATVGVAYSYQIPTPGGTGPFTYTLNGPLPAGLLLDPATGVIAGTPTGAGSSGTFTVTVDNALTSQNHSGSDTTASVTFTSSVATPSFTPSSVTVTAAFQDPISYQPVQTLGTTPATVWAATGLPNGVSINTVTGLISGPSPGPGTYSGSVVTASYGGQSGQVALTFVVTPQHPIMGASTTLTQPVGHAFTFTIPNTGGPVASCAVTGANQPPSGVSVSVGSGGCVLSGTSTLALGSSTFTVQAQNTGGSAVTVVTLNMLALPVVNSPVDVYWPTGVTSTVTVAPTSGSAPFTFTSSNLPSGWALDGGSGVLTGTPTSVGVTSVNVFVSNPVTGGSPVGVGVNVHGVDAPVWGGVTLPQASLGVAYTGQLPTPGGTGPFTYTVTGLPAGLTLNPATGAITGTPTVAAGPATVTFTATNQDAATAGASGAVVAGALHVGVGVAMSVNVLPPVYTDTYTKVIATSDAFMVTPQLLSGSPATAWSVTSGVLPSWLSLNAQTGVLSAPAGAPTVGVVEPAFVVTGSNGASPAATISYQLTVQALPVAPVVAPPAATVGVAYSYQIPTPGGTGPFTYTLNGTLPAGLLLDPATGVIAGTPTGAGSSGTFTVTVDNALTSQNHSGSDTTASVTFTSSVATPSFTPSSVTVTAAFQDPISYQPVQTLGTTPATVWAATGLPGGLSINTVTGLISGPSPGPGTYSGSVVTASYGGQSGQVALTFVVTPQHPIMGASTTLTQPVGHAFTFTIPNTGGPVASCAVTGANQPPSGVSVSVGSGGCVLSGTSTLALGSSTFTVQAQNTGGSAVTVVTLNMLALPVVNSPVDVYWPTGVTSTVTVAPTSGSAPFTFTSSNLPSGWALDGGSGVLTGTPTSVGVTSVNVFVSNPVTGGSPVGVGVNVHGVDAPVWGGVTLPQASLGVAYTGQLPTPGGTGPFTYTVTGLPAGLTLNPATGAITGTPTVAAGPATVTFTATNQDAATAGASGAVVAGALHVGVGVAMSVNVLPPVYTDTYTKVIATSDAFMVTPQLLSGSPATAWSVTSGVLPSWLSLNAQTGVLSAPAGAPTVGVVEPAFVVTGSNGASPAATISYQLTVQALPVAPVVAPPAATVGVAYSYQIPTPGGTGPFTYTLNGTLPAGLLLDPATGVIAGTPTGAGSSGTFTVTVDNALTSQNHSGSDTTASVTFTSSVATPSFTPSSVTVTAAFQDPISYQPVQTLGTTPATVWAATGLPGGLSINTVTGLISGPSPGPGTYSGSVVTASYGGQSGQVALTFVVTPQHPIMGASTTLTQPVGHAFTFTIPNTGGPVASCAVTGANQPPSGVSVSVGSGGCVLSGTSTLALGSSTFTVQAQNTGGSAVTVVTLNMLALPVVNSPVDVYWPTGVTSTVTVAPTSGSAPFTFTSSNLPSGWALDGGSGVLTGTPTSVGVTSVNVFVSNPVTGGSPVGVGVNVHGVDAPVWGGVTLPQASLGVAYTGQLPTPGGTGPFTYTVTGLPAGLTLNPATGAITGTPTVAAGPATVTFTATNQDAATAGASGAVVAGALHVGVGVAMSVNVLPPVYTDTYTKVIATSDAFMVTPQLLSGSPATAWSVTSGVLPSWLSLNAQTGVLSAPAGAPTVGVVEPAFVVTGSNGASPAATISYQLTVQALPVAPVVAPPAATVGVAYSYQIPTPGGTGPFTYTLNGTLPAGLLLDPATGVIAGTPTGAGSSGTFTVTVDNALTSQNHSGSDTTASVTFTSSVATPSFTPSSTALMSANLAPVSYMPTQSPGTTPATVWTATNLPNGVSINSATGAITGTPTIPGVFNVIVTAAVGSGPGAPSGQQSISYTVTAPPLVQPVNATFGYEVLGSVQINAAGSYPAVTSYTASGAPGWITVDPSSGLITGTAPSSALSPVTFTVSASNGVGSHTVAQVSIALAVVAPTVAPTTTAPNVSPWSTATLQLVRSGGSPASSFTLGTSPAGANNTAPSWVSINTSSGLVTFTDPPALALGSTFTFPLTLSNSAGFATTTVSATVRNVPFIPPTLTLAVSTGSAWTHDLGNDIVSANGPFSWAVVAGSAPVWAEPSGLFASGAPSGVVTGTPTTTGTSTFTVAVTNAVGSSQTVVTVVALNPPVLAGGMLPQATTGQPYTVSLAATAASGPFNYTATGVPPGMSLDQASGVLTGTPTLAGMYSIRVTAADTSYPSIQATVLHTLQVIAAPTVGGSAAPSGGVSGSTGPQSTAVGGSTSPGQSVNPATTAPTSLPSLSVAHGAAVTAMVPGIPGQRSTFQISSGTLPSGVSLDPNTGQISGVAGSGGSFSVVITVVGVNGQTQLYRLDINVGSSTASQGDQPSSGANPWMLAAGAIALLISAGLAAFAGTKLFRRWRLPGR